MLVIQCEWSIYYPVVSGLEDLAVDPLGPVCSAGWYGLHGSDQFRHVPQRLYQIVILGIWGPCGHIRISVVFLGSVLSSVVAERFVILGRVLSLWGRILTLQWCLDGWCASGGVHTDARTQQFSAEHCLVMKWSMHIVADLPIINPAIKKQLPPKPLQQPWQLSGKHFRYTASQLSRNCQKHADSWRKMTFQFLNGIKISLSLYQTGVWMIRVIQTFTKPPTYIT